MPAPPLILLPPSEGKGAGGDGPPWAPGTIAFDELDGMRARLLRSLAAAMRKPLASRAKLLGVKGEALQAATAVNLETTLGTSPTHPAIERYTGVLYDALDHGSLAARDRARLDAQVLICSALWGVVRPPDLIPDYKLKMGASLPRLGRLSTWWRDPLSAAVAAELRDRVVWNLLPNEHADALAPALAGPEPASALTVQFLDEVDRDGVRSFTRVNHWNKLLKGALVRHVLAQQVTDPEALADFDHPLGYRYDPTRTERDGRTTTLTLVKPLEP